MSTGTSTPKSIDYLTAYINAMREAAPQFESMLKAWLDTKPPVDDARELLVILDELRTFVGEQVDQITHYLLPSIAPTTADRFIEGAITAFNEKMAAFNGEAPAGA